MMSNRRCGNCPELGNGGSVIYPSTSSVWEATASRQPSRPERGANPIVGLLVAAHQFERYRKRSDRLLELLIRRDRYATHGDSIQSQCFDLWTGRRVPRFCWGRSRGILTAKRSPRSVRPI